MFRGNDCVIELKPQLDINPLNVKIFSFYSSSKLFHKSSFYSCVIEIEEKKNVYREEKSVKNIISRKKEYLELNHPSIDYNMTSMMLMTRLIEYKGKLYYSFLLKRINRDILFFPFFSRFQG